MPVITVYPSRGSKKTSKFFVPVCPQCEGKGYIVKRTYASKRGYCQRCTRCGGQK